MHLRYAYNRASANIPVSTVHIEHCMILLDIIIPISGADVRFPFFYQFVESLNRYLFFVDMMQMTTIHLLLLYKLCKHMQRLRACYSSTPVA